MREMLDSVLANLSESHSLSLLLGAAALLAGIMACHFAVRRILFSLVGRLSSRIPPLASELIYDETLFRRLSYFISVIIFYQGVEFVPHLPAHIVAFSQKIAVVTSIVIVLNIIGSVLRKGNDIYCRYPIARSRPIKGYLQVITITLYAIGLILCIATLLDRSPLVFISGLGALTAVIMLVFRDTLLSLVAGMQLTTNNLIQVGDWIEMPQFGADGDVVDIALHVVKVQNWDRTITVIPTHKFLEHSFKNWRGMQDSGGRRIKRSINIDVSTIRFLQDDEIERFGRFALLKDYITQKRGELDQHNQKFSNDPSMIVNSRRLTNVGTFRAYIANYLKQNSGIHQHMTFIVRQLQPTPDGLPLEVYVFANDTRWANYEGIQADIFDHILAIVHEFGLSIHQRPSGTDVRQAARFFVTPKLDAKLHELG